MIPALAHAAQMPHVPSRRLEERVVGNSTYYTPSFIFYVHIVPTYAVGGSGHCTYHIYVCM